MFTFFICHTGFAYRQKKDFSIKVLQKGVLKEKTKEYD